MTGVDGFVRGLKESETLEHFGKKGMKWGVRKDTHVRTSVDARKAQASKAKAETHGDIKALTNHELTKFNKRMELEQKFSKLTEDKKKVDKGHDFVKQALLVGVTVNSVVAFSKSPAGKFLKENFVKGPKGGHFKSKGEHFKSAAAVGVFSLGKKK